MSNEMYCQRCLELEKKIFELEEELLKKQVTVNSLSFLQAAKWFLNHEKRRHFDDIYKIVDDLEKMEGIEIPQEALDLVHYRFDIGKLDNSKEENQANVVYCLECNKPMEVVNGVIDSCLRWNASTGEFKGYVCIECARGNGGKHEIPET